MTDPQHQPDYRVGNDGFWAKAWRVPLVLAVVGAVITLIFAGDTARLGYAYLYSFFTVVTFMLGAMFLVLIQFLTGAHWGVSSRRVPEVIMASAPVVAVLAVPFLVGVGVHRLQLYTEWQDLVPHAAHGEESKEHQDEHGSLGLGASVALAQADSHGEVAEAHGDDHHGEAHEEEHAHTPQEAALHHEILESKVGYLNTAGWLTRSVLYLVFWSLIALGYFGWSRRQDDSKDPKYTVRMQQLSAPALMLFAGTLTFAAFDWLMSLEAAWFSTIFGVVLFAGSAVCILAITILITLSFYRRGLVGKAINVEHFHDMSKLMFGFVCFWTYVQFSQWMLIWYAGIPEEATWFHKRWEGGWSFVSVFLILGSFVAPFLLLISRLQKRSLRWLQAMCFWIVFMHIVDIYWFVLPQAGAFGVHPVDVGALLFVGGVFFTYVFWRFTQVPLLPVGDPRLARSLHHHQTH